MASFRAFIFAISVVLSGCGGSDDTALARLEPSTNIQTDACMQAGLQIVNANGIVQIDQNFLNLEYRTKYSTSGTTLIFTTPGYANEVIVVRANGAAFYVDSKVGNTWTIKSNATTLITAWLFSEPTTAAGNSGFEIYREDGSLVFSSNKRYMRPVWSGKVPNSAAVGAHYSDWAISDYSVSLTSGNYAAALCGGRRSVHDYYPVGGADGSLIVWDGVEVTSTGASVGGRFSTLIPAPAYGGVGQIAQGTGGWLTIVDVSDL